MACPGPCDLVLTLETGKRASSLYGRSPLNDHPSIVPKQLATAWRRGLATAERNYRAGIPERHYKGLRSAVKKVFRDRALVHRCQWHKRENVVSYLPKSEQGDWRRRLQRAYNRPTYPEALAALEQLHGELDDRNQSAAGSLAEGLDETLTLHRLSVYAVLGRSFKTTNCLESVNALVEERCAKVDQWKNSSQRQRWLATALVDIEPRLRKVVGYRHLPKLREALQRELKIERKTPNTKAA